MTTTLQSHGGGAQPASIDTSGKVTGGTALRIYGFDSAEAAHAAGYVCEGGPAMSVALITDAQIASGAWKAEGDPSATIIYTAPSSMPVEGGYAVPIYAVNGWGSTPAPAPVSDPIGDALRADAIAYWTMNEESGTRLDSKNDYDLLEFDDSSLDRHIAGVAGLISKAAFLDSTNYDVIFRMADAPAFRSNSQIIYISTWIYVIPNSSVQVTIFSKTQGDPYYYDIILMANTTETNFTARISVGGSPWPFVDDLTARDFNSWVWLEGYVDAANNQMGLATNNEAFVTGAIGQTLTGGTGMISLGSESAEDSVGGISVKSIDIDETLVMHRKPTQDERDYLYNSGTGRALFPAP